MRADLARRLLRCAWPVVSWAVNTTKDYDSTTTACVDTLTTEFYEIDEHVPVPKLDLEDDNLLDGRELTHKQRRNLASLRTEMRLLKSSVRECEGDGNLDGVINALDVVGWARFRRMNGGKSSWYDVNLDGLTDEADLALIIESYGKRCGNGAQTRPVHETAE